ncbi:hypothetical protein FHR24_002770 [Wenyingzhuangia heitensis]|uniref:CAAX prenyl protease 2/Lysostaphin resistance protein A-like domain-containing protein n=1 Tax=Wenyingzhuangia heitensis TaxID=1487859 RepID=A0ABX0UFU9_9FLAO|nr:CPBP family intramembrane glutamic endopeptidase [Wenyingzhuangia heitensis]NIJ46286.1 hypothetical protein [Wenyingzhuangia heitensis]
MENKYIAQASKGNSQAWRYVVGIVIVIVLTGLFSLPYNFAIASKIDSGTADATRIQDFSYLMTLFDSNVSLIFMMLPFVGSLVGLYLVVIKLHNVSWSVFSSSSSKIDVKKIVFSFLLWGTISAMIILLGVLLNPEEIILNFKPAKFALLFLIAIVMIPIQTSFEEYIFRGYLMQGLGWISKTSWFPLVVTSIAFGLMHIANPEVDKLGNGIMVFYIGTGLLLGVITLMDEGIELSLGFHAANNLITALLVTTDWTAFQTYAIFKDFSSPNLMAELILIAILYPLLLLVFAKKYQWTGWKEKLV